MPDFYYKAVNKGGDEKEGVISAVSYKDAFMRIKGEGFYPVEIYQEAHRDQAGYVRSSLRRRLSRLFRPKIKVKQLAPLISDLAVLIDSGISLVRALTILQRQTISRHLRGVIQDLRSDVESGQTFSDALSKHPDIFSKLFINMIRAGEVGGILSEALERLSILYEKSARLEAKLKAALTYPLLVLFFAVAVVIFVVAIIVPKFFVIFSDIGADLPALTVMLYTLSNLVRHWWFPLLIVCFGCGVAVRLSVAVPQVRYMLDLFILRIPVFGKVMSKVSISRFCRTFGTLLASGVPILQTLSIAKDAAGNRVYERAVERVKDSIKEGESVAGPLSHYGIFPPLVTNMITVGEETGELSTMLIKIADRYDDEVDTLIGQLTTLIEPFLIVGMGVIVGFIVIALFLPLASIVEKLTGI